MHTIYIVPIDNSPRIWLKPLEAGISKAFGTPTKSADLKINTAQAFDLSRLQYNSSHLLLELIARRPSDAFKILGVVEVDLFVPVLTFVFGEAQLDGPAAVVSIHRLNNIFYGLPEDRELMIERLVKESIHELGHTFGLIHCTNPGCVLNSSTYVEDIDQKEETFCDYCQDLLNNSKRRVPAPPLDKSIRVFPRENISNPAEPAAPRPHVAGPQPKA